MANLLKLGYLVASVMGASLVMQNMTMLNTEIASDVSVLMYKNSAVLTFYALLNIIAFLSQRK